MIVRFWGVRGSLPSPESQKSIREKISDIIEKILPEDLASPASKERFIKGLPPWLYGFAGGNTPCVSVQAKGFKEIIILDSGSGIRDLGVHFSAKQQGIMKYHILFSHFHWDHVQGFPFFTPGYNSKVKIDLYSPKKRLENILSNQMKSPYFPVKMDKMAAQRNYHCIDSPFSIGPCNISFRKMVHPGDSYSYKISHKGKNMIYATDTELSQDDFLPNPENTSFFAGADLIILDAQYTLGEATDKYLWGHSAFSLAVDFAAAWGIKHLVLFHHDPAYDDQKLYGILRAAQLYIQQMEIKELEISLAFEGLEITL